jgi:hypothetical protein
VEYARWQATVRINRLAYYTKAQNITLKSFTVLAHAGEKSFRMAEKISCSPVKGCN